MKLLEIINVDFSLRHFVLPLMEGARARGHEVIGVCAEGPLLADVRARGFRVETVPPMRSLNPAEQLRALTALIRIIRAERPDVVHAHMPIAGFLGRLAATLCGVPRVAYTVHGFLFNQTGPLPQRAASVVLEWVGARMTDRFLTVSTTEARDARRLLWARDPIAVGNGRDPSVFRPDTEARSRIRAALGVADDRVVITVVSRLVRSKGHAELVEAMRDVIRRAPKAELWVVGERLATDRGDDVGAVLDAAAVPGALGPHLRRLGYRADVADVLAASDIFVLPSHYEALPMSVIEAMLTGLPVVASDIDGPREQVVDGVTGLLVPPLAPTPLADALSRLALDPALRSTMGAAGRARAETLFDERIVVGRTLDAIGL